METNTVYKYMVSSYELLKDLCKNIYCSLFIELYSSSHKTIIL